MSLIESLILLLSKDINFFIKRKLFFLIKIGLLFLCFIGCGCQLITDKIYNKNETTDNTPKTYTILLQSYDPFHSITQLIKDELYWNHINIINKIHNNCYSNYDKLNIPYLKIIHITNNHLTVSVFPDGTECEYQIILQIQAQYSIPNKINNYPIDIQVHRSFIRNPKKDLSNLIQEKEIIEDMYRNLAQKLVQQFLIHLKN